jgi:hypothetical protein
MILVSYSHPMDQQSTEPKATPAESGITDEQKTQFAKLVRTMGKIHRESRGLPPLAEKPKRTR